MLNKVGPTGPIRYERVKLRGQAMVKTEKNNNKYFDQ